jgi:EAL domain-containing protein (putative c-di-GMP-specific phosphodiesterase class I)
MIRDADNAMYVAKVEGKGRAVVFTPTMHAAAMARLEMEADLRWAIERDELRLHYQPIVALDTGQIVGLEALMRWEHPRRGLLYPAEFLAVAEDSGLIASMSWWAMRAAALQVAAWQRDMPPAEAIWVSVNLSSRQLSEPDMLSRIRAILDESGLPSQCLKLEITEQSIVAHGEATIQLLTAIRELGIQLCIDDFGTGYSSLSYLQRFPVDVLKIDRSFVSQLGEHGTVSEIVQTILNLARALGMQAVAEGTETLQQADELRRLECEFGQGWLFSRALDPQAISGLMRKEPLPNL